jgi:hypothetical protein
MHRHRAGDFVSDRIYDGLTALQAVFDSFRKPLLIDGCEQILDRVPGGAFPAACGWSDQDREFVQVMGGGLFAIGPAADAITESH